MKDKPHIKSVVQTQTRAFTAAKRLTEWIMEKKKSIDDGTEVSKKRQNFSMPDSYMVQSPQAVNCIKSHPQTKTGWKGKAMQNNIYTYMCKETAFSSSWKYISTKHS